MIIIMIIVVVVVEACILLVLLISSSSSSSIITIIIITPVTIMIVVRITIIIAIIIMIIAAPRWAGRLLLRRALVLARDEEVAPLERSGISGEDGSWSRVSPIKFHTNNFHASTERVMNSHTKVAVLRNSTLESPFCRIPFIFWDFIPRQWDSTWVKSTKTGS